MLNIELIKEKIGDIFPPECLHYYKTTDSTNTRAIEYARELGERCPERAAFIAEGQTAGRGRRTRSFVSETGAGIFLTLIYSPRSESDTERMTSRAAVALKEAIFASTGVEAGIKWVNDLYAKLPDGRQKKLAGILAEAVTENGRISKIVVGMGINIYKNAISDEISDIAVSLEDVAGERYQREEIAAAIIKEFYRERDESEVLREYREASLTLNKTVTVIPHSAEPYDAFAKQINEDYSLTVIDAEGRERRIFSGEVRTKLN